MLDRAVRDLRGKADRHEPTARAVHRRPDPDALLDRPRRQPAAGLRHARARPPRRGAQVACLPELFRTQYFCQVEDAAIFDLAEPIPGPTTEALAGVARETRMVVVGSIFERRAAGIYHNTAVVLDADGSLRGRYRKMHIPDDPLYYEKYYFTPGDLGFQAIETQLAPRRHARLLGPVVSRGRPADRPAGGRDPLLPDGDRLAPGREGRVRRGPGRRLGDRSSAPTRSATASSSRPSTASATKDRPTAASNSGAARSSPTPSAGSSPAPAATAKRS